ncbi:hypothetical protein SAMN05421877_108122 [Sphingobacterium lactis]|uniref:Uncharacterized protein n=1 Tax=Sphingobacterium lactis TaxID=797291 RepID=A0A1H6AGH8_9SPHI|nr:hypothetical protein SAMN05421877_108122 [Sphingobacterium lactis]
MSSPHTESSPSLGYIAQPVMAQEDSSIRDHSICMDAGLLQTKE